MARQPLACMCVCARKVLFFHIMNKNQNIPSMILTAPFRFPFSSLSLSCCSVCYSVFLGSASRAGGFDVHAMYGFACREHGKQTDWDGGCIGSKGWLAHKSGVAIMLEISSLYLVLLVTLVLPPCRDALHSAPTGNHASTIRILCSRTFSTAALVTHRP